MKALVLCALLASGALLIHPRANAEVPSAADSALAAAGSFKIYPLFTLGGGHIHNLQHCTVDNGFSPATHGWIRTTLSSIRFNVFSSVAGADSSGFTILAGETYSSIGPCDSIRVVNTGGTATTVTWGLYR